MNQSSEYFDLSDLFTEVNSSFKRSANFSDMKESLSSSILLCALSKCVDFNLLAHKTEAQNPSFFLLANLRILIEELVYNSVFKKIGDSSASELIEIINYLTYLKNLKAQKRFFAGNKSNQPIYGEHVNVENLKQKIRDVKNVLKEAWCQQGFILHRGGNPSIRTLAESVGLETTYEYFYNITSELVHFNPQQLFRMGWGTEDGTVTFETHHFEPYYSALSKFIGAMVFLGYCFLAPQKFEKDTSTYYAETITNKFDGSFRWPEFVTYEQMNVKPPHILVQAVLKRIQQEDTTFSPMADVFTELRGLRFCSN